MNKTHYHQESLQPNFTNAVNQLISINIGNRYSIRYRQ